MTTSPRDGCGTRARVTPSTPDRGEVWFAALDPVLSGEQGGTRPVLVVSTAAFNSWPVGLVVIVPITTRDRGFDHHIPVTEGGLDRASYAMPEYVRSIAQRRLQRRLGATGASTLEEVDGWLRRINGL